MRRLVTLTFAVALLAALAGSANATLLFSDLFEWYDDGTVIRSQFTPAGPTVVVRGPGGVPVHGGGGSTPDFLIKIEEDVITFDAVVHPFVPLGVDRYVYTISNVGYDSGNVGYNFVAQFGAPGPLPGVGINGLSGFNIQNLYSANVLLQGLPPADPVTGTPWTQGSFSGPGNMEWDIPPIGSTGAGAPGGWGIGAPVAGSPLTMNSFFFDVAAGTPHGILPAWVHSWAGPNPPPLQVNVMTGFLSGPVPEPGTILLLGGGLLGTGLSLLRRKRR